MSSFDAIPCRARRISLQARSAFNVQRKLTLSRAMTASLMKGMRRRLETKPARVKSQRVRKERRRAERTGSVLRDGDRLAHGDSERTSTLGDLRIGLESRDKLDELHHGDRVD